MNISNNDQNTTTTTTTTKLQNTASPITASEVSNAAVAQACAACKHQRRRCTPNCPLAPYFPANKQQDFLKVHKLFGVSNIVKLLKEMPQHEKQNAMTSVIIQADIRAKDPVGGCHRLIRELEKAIHNCRLELDMVLKSLNFYRAQRLLNGEMPNSNVNDLKDKPRSVGVGVENILVHERVHEGGESSSQATDCPKERCSDQELIIKVESVEQFLNDKPGDIKPDLLGEKHDCKK
ncbi:hypothetical protein Pfo_024789 [Paulownia fortunei]|nr:hypothetical protein Pfo_024789 [Paulownia fortunei]